jgi:hypothetical protein
LARRFVEIDPRVAKQDAKKAVRDPIDALIELITNSMDSYNRLKGGGHRIPREMDGRIEVYLSRRKKKSRNLSVIGVKDWAEGIAPDQMKKYISGYGGRTSGKERFQSIRGYFGRGLKDAAGGLDGKGTMYSIKDGTISKGVIHGSSKLGIEFDDVETFEKTQDNLNRFHLDGGARTIAMVEFDSRKTRLPIFGKFSEKLQNCVYLRNLMESGNIRLLQMDRGKTVKELDLKYNRPKHVILHSETGRRIDGTTKMFDITVRRAEVELTQGEEGKYREGGLLIMSGTSVHEATLLKFERDPSAARFFGEVRCDHIDRLMQEDESVVSPDREGLNWGHDFLKKLKKSIEETLHPLVKREEMNREKRKKGLSESALKRNSRMGKKLGKLYREIMKEEKAGLKDLWGEGEGKKEGILIPESGFGFVPSYYPLELKRKEKLRLVIQSPKVVPSYGVVHIEVDDSEFVLEKEEYPLVDGDYREKEGVYVLSVPVTGLRLGVKGIVKASTRSKAKEDLVAEAIVDAEEPKEYPLEGFGFVPDNYRIRVNRTKKVLLKVDSDLLAAGGMKVRITSDNKYIIPDTDRISLESSSDHLVESRISVMGTKSGEEGVIQAADVDNEMRVSEARVKVISGVDRPKGFDIEYDETNNPIQRSTYSREEGKIFIFVREPTVHRYYDEGQYCDNLSFLVLCADLITDAFCNRVVEDLREGDKIQTLGEDIETAIQRKLHQLKRNYGPMIHNTYVSHDLLERERKR